MSRRAGAGEVGGNARVAGGRCQRRRGAMLATVETPGCEQGRWPSESCEWQPGPLFDRLLRWKQTKAGAGGAGRLVRRLLWSPG